MYKRRRENWTQPMIKNEQVLSLKDYEFGKQFNYCSHFLRKENILLLPSTAYQSNRHKRSSTIRGTRLGKNKLKCNEFNSSIIGFS
jgi:hypothetical protein